MMINEPGIGFHVFGELYEIHDSTLAELDRIESVGIPGNIRMMIEVQPIDGGPSSKAFAFMKARELAHPAHTGYLRCYQDRRFIPFDRRGEGR
jgi:gamma-glutamylaminecyclotransferase